ncbi:MAG: NAD(P)H-hydrate dehydratase [Rhodobacteraceae bacterium]|nr:NAD(P)H-hydrate dehydratase [Paracoccaceae bacterium]
MTELLTAAQMRSIEQAAIDSGEVTALELMERAGKAVVETILEEWPLFRQAPQSATILCGPGNNGGDGFVVARLLKDLDWNVRVLFLGDENRLPKDARINHDIWSAFGPIEPLSLAALRRNVSTIYIDALFGTGLSRPLEAEALAVITHLAGRQDDDAWRDTVAIDAPSGLCMDSGRFLGQHAIERLARLTVAFDSPKAGHFLDLGPQLCGRLVVRDIGLLNWRCFAPKKGAAAKTPPFTMKGGIASGAERMPRLRLVANESLVPDLRAAARGLPPLDLLSKGGSRDHKYAHGHALILSGPAGRTGAARLAALGALRIGTGLVTVGSPGNAMAENAAHLTAIMLREVNDANNLADALKDTRISAVCLGPGLGIRDETMELVRVALASQRPVVLDADALSIFQNNEKELFKQLHQRSVLTPHAGEFARLFPDIANRFVSEPMSGPAYSRVDAARAAAKRAGCVVLLKGPDTVIAAPDGTALIHAAAYDRCAPWLATAGAGDVLAGFITGLLARGFLPPDAAAMATWLHVEAARRFGPGLIAEDLPEALPGIFRANAV